jgi:phage terminase large subunit-like protein
VVPVIDTALKTGKDHDGLAVTYLGVARHGQVKYSTYVLDWDYKQIEGALLADWLPTVFARCEELVVEYRCRYGAAKAQIEDKGSGTVLIQQAQNAGLPAMAIESGLTAMGKAERAFNVSNYVHAGNCKFTPHAYNKMVTFKGITKNHLLAQILNFRAGTQETAADDCLDTWTYALALVIGNYLGF